MIDNLMNSMYSTVPSKAESKINKVEVKKSKKSKKSKRSKKETVPEIKTNDRESAKLMTWMGLN